MAVSISSFEEEFSEARLKEGLNLAQKHLLEVVKISPGSYRFVFEKKRQSMLQLGRRGNQIISWKCSCGKKMCAHLAAALFYFSSSRLDLKRGSSQKSGAERLKDYATEFRKLLQKELENSGKKLLEDEAAVRISNEFLKRIENNDAQIARLSALIELSKHLVYAELLPVRNVSSGLKNIIDELKLVRKQKLSTDEKSAWKEASAQSLKIQAVFKSGIYLYLLPFTLSFVRDGITLDELRDLAFRRRKEKRFFTFLNLPLLAEMMVMERQAELSGKSSASEKLSPEMLIARAELKLVKRKIQEALSLLKSGNDELKIIAPLTYPSYLAYGLSVSEDADLRDYELFFMKEILLHDRSIDVSLLDRAKQLLNAMQWKNWIREIIHEIRTQNKEWNFDKLAEMLEHENMLEELINLIKTQKNKFQLLQRVAMKKLPEYSETLFRIYVEQLENLIYEAREPYRQEKIYQLVKAYLDKLPEKAASDLENKILERISKNNSVYQLLKSS
jgi:hypothetical protein